MTRPVLWSFRRCPYAMRARLGLASAGITVELREVVLRDKPRAFLDTSPSATVPCLDTGRGVIDESLDIMIWALEQNDPEKWLKMPKEGFDLIVMASTKGDFPNYEIGPNLARVVRNAHCTVMVVRDQSR